MKKVPNQRHTTSFTVFYLAIAFIYAAVFVGAEFAGSPVSGIRGLAALGFQWGVLAAASSAIIGLLALNRYVFVALFPALTAASAIAAYFRVTLGISLTPTAVELAFQNDMSTWGTMVTWQLAAFTLLCTGLAAAAAAARFRLTASPRHPWLWALAFAAVVSVTTRVDRLREPVKARMPYSLYYSFKDYHDNRVTASENRDTFDRVAAKTDNDSLTVMFVIGEALRPDHLGLNGYSRQTTPGLSSEANLVSFPNMRTDYCFTYLSVPHIMTRLDESNPDYAFEEQSFITLFRKAGFHTSWLSNQDQCGTYVYFMNEADTLAFANGTASLYSHRKWLDSDLLPLVDEVLAKPEPLKLAVVHAIGSHWWYRSHHTEEQAIFKPEIDSRIVSELSREQMVNSYDNTVIATDEFLSGIIDRIRNDNSVMIFISDHGEALGEDGNYLHGDSYEPVRHTACLVWYSDRYAEKHPRLAESLRLNSGRCWTTTAMFHSVLEAAGIETAAADQGNSLFNAATAVL